MVTIQRQKYEEPFMLCGGPDAAASMTAGRIAAEKIALPVGEPIPAACTIAAGLNEHCRRCSNYAANSDMTIALEPCRGTGGRQRPPCCSEVANTPADLEVLA